jgi:hypothetical protein
MQRVEGMTFKEFLFSQFLTMKVKDQCIYMATGDNDMTKHALQVYHCICFYGKLQG